MLQNAIRASFSTKVARLIVGSVRTQNTGQLSGSFNLHEARNQAKLPTIINAVLTASSKAHRMVCNGRASGPQWCSTATVRCRFEIKKPVRTFGPNRLQLHDQGLGLGLTEIGKGHEWMNSH